MRLEAQWLIHPGTRALFDMLGDDQAWVVGGSVRDGLLGRGVEDVDLCTTLLPQEVIDRAEAAGLRAVPTGLDHGTVTVVAHGRPHEITTLRCDIETDGRHARVIFSTDIAEDAARRDFTMNALYATRDGAVLDPTGKGLADLAARRVRFIGQPEARIAEDYLRILRFFRFYAGYGDPELGIDPEGLAACAAGRAGLKGLSRERIGQEMRKLLLAPDPAPALASMHSAGILGAILPGADPKLLPVLVWCEERLGDCPPDALRRLAALGGEGLQDALRLSRAEARDLEALRAEMGASTGAEVLGYRHGVDRARDVLLLRGSFSGLAPTVQDLEQARAGAKAVFPIRADDLMPELSGPALGKRLRELETAWIESRFTLNREALLAL